MAVQISESFQLYAHAPLDSRTQFRTVAEMRSFPTSRLYEGIIASVVENTTTYQFFSSNEVTEETGKWRIFGANNTTTEPVPVHEHDRDAVHIIMSIANADVQPGDNYLYIGSEPYSAPGKNLVTGDIFTVNNDGTFTVLFHVGSGNGGSSDPVIPETISDPIIVITNGTVTLVCNTENAVIHYTLDGTDPNSSSAVYTEPFTLSEDTTVKAIAIKDDKTSSVVTKVYEAPVIPVTADPVITISNGIATVTCATEGARIFYTLDGSNPDSTSETYEGPITLTGDTVIKAIAVKNDILSSVVTETYTAPVPDSVEEPEIIIDQDGQVTMICPTANAIIYYTTDGSDPTDSSSVYSEAFTVADGTTVKAIAVKGTAQSLVISDTYTAEKSYAYYGILSGSLGSTERITDEGVEVNEATVSALNKVETTSAAGEVAFVASEADYNAAGQSFVVYAYPAKFGELTTYDFGLGTNPMSNTFTKFDVVIDGELYYVYAQTRGFAPTRVGATYNYTFN